MDADYKDNKELMQELIDKEVEKKRSEMAPKTQSGRTRRMVNYDS